MKTAFANPKQPKSRVDYEHPAQGEYHCSQCVNFRPEQNACTKVIGRIEPEDWCKLFKRKT